jgi:hypothetical protein
MKLSFLGAIALALLTTAPAFAQMHDDHNHGQMQQRNNMQHNNMQHHNMQQHQRYHQGQIYHGHHLQNRNGHWGYYQPRNGSQVFISIPL